MSEFDRIWHPVVWSRSLLVADPFSTSSESLKREGHTGCLKALSMMFENFDEARARYDRWEFVHSNREGPGEAR